MNKKELISVVAKETGLSKKVVEKVFTQIFETIKDVMAERNKIAIKGFGTFTAKERKAKKGRHPKTGDEIDIPARMVPVFKPGSQLKDLVASGKKSKSGSKKKSAKKSTSSKKKTTTSKKKSTKKSSKKKK